MPHKENRKIIRIGQTSLAVILPMPWLKFFDVKYGDSVEVISNDDITIKRIKKY